MERRITFYDDLDGPAREQEQAFLKLAPNERLNVMFRLRRRLRWLSPNRTELPTRGIEIRRSHVD